jgi:hypothetical protein
VTAVSEHIVAADDLRHRAADHVKTRDSLFWNLVLPEERLAAQVYLWVDGRGVAGRQVTVYTPDPDLSRVLVRAHVELGPECDLDAVEIAGLRMSQPDPLTTAELSFDSEQH